MKTWLSILFWVCNLCPGYGMNGPENGCTLQARKELFLVSDEMDITMIEGELIYSLTLSKDEMQKVTSFLMEHTVDNISQNDPLIPDHRAAIPTMAICFKKQLQGYPKPTKIATLSIYPQLFKNENHMVLLKRLILDLFQEGHGEKRLF